MDEYDEIPGVGGHAWLAVRNSATIVNVNFSSVHSNGWSLNTYAIDMTDEECVFDSQTTTDGGYISPAVPRVIGARIGSEFWDGNISASTTRFSTIVGG